MPRYLDIETASMFVSWLRANGAEVLPTTNVYELARFVAHGKTNVVYFGRRGVRAIGFAQECVDAYESGASLNMGIRQKPRNNISKRKIALRQRDGDLCFYCFKPMFRYAEGEKDETDDATIEHLVGRGKGGPDHQDNLVLAHDSCNKIVANLPLVSKLKVRENKIHERYRNQAA